jgi:predicted DNA-binding protein
MPQKLSEFMMTQFGLPPHLFHRLDEEAAKEGRTRANMTREIIRRYFSELDAKAGQAQG